MKDTATNENATPVRAPADKEHRSAVRAALFLLGGLAAAGLVLVILANSHRLFDRKNEYVVYFPDVDGLTVGSPVRLGGLDVGNVEAITFAPTLMDTRIEVRLKVSKAFASRIRGDSVARVASLGVLGDKTVAISMGSDRGMPIANGGELVAGSGGDIASVIKSSTEVIDNVVAISNDVRKAIDGFTDPAMRAELAGTVKSLHAILDQTANGNGAVHALFFDPKTGADVTVLLTNAAATAKRLDGAVAKADAMLDQVNSGDGAAHALLYGPEGKKTLTELTAAATEVTTMIRDVKASKNGAVHAMLYGDSKAMVDDLAAAASNLKSVTAKVDKGEGSLGALVNDPTVYEDLKTVLGNVKRNRVLRELVRFTVSNRGEFEAAGKSSGDAIPEASPALQPSPVPLSLVPGKQR